MKAHGRRLARLGLVPADLHAPSDLGTALRWTGRRLPLLLAGAMAIVGLLLVSGPMILADLATRDGGAGQAGRASRHLYVGSALVLVWWAALALTAGLIWGIALGAAALLLLPIAGLAGLAVQQAWALRLHQARRWLFLRFGAAWHRRLLADQASLGDALEELVARPPSDVPA